VRDFKLRLPQQASSLTQQDTCEGIIVQRTLSLLSKQPPLSFLDFKILNFAHQGIGPTRKQIVESLN